jgi:hypothetical protein
VNVFACKLRMTVCVGVIGLAIAFVPSILQAADGKLAANSAAAPSWSLKIATPIRKGVIAIVAQDPGKNYVEFVEYPDLASYRPDLFKWRQFFLSRKVMAARILAIGAGIGVA